MTDEQHQTTEPELADNPAEVPKAPANADLGKQPTQTVYPWRATLRTMIAAAIAFIPIGTALITASDLDSVPLIAGFLGLGAAITRVMAMPETEAFLQRYAPWLAASEYQAQHRKDIEK